MQTAILLKAKEAAKILNVPVQKVRDLLRDKELKGLRYGKNDDWRILSSDLEEYMARILNEEQRVVWDKRFGKPLPKKIGRPKGSKNRPKIK